MKRLFHLSFATLLATILLVACNSTPKQRNIHLSETSITMTVGDKKRLVVEDINEKFTLTWHSENQEIAEVNTQGEVNAKKVGHTRIKVHVLCPCKKEFDLYCDVDVKAP